MSTADFEILAEMDRADALIALADLQHAAMRETAIKVANPTPNALTAAVERGDSPKAVAAMICDAFVLKFPHDKEPRS